MRHRLLSSIACTWLACLTASHGGAAPTSFAPASQEFAQEIPRGLRQPGWLNGQPVQLLDLVETGAHKAYAGGAWFTLNQTVWTAATNAAPDPAAGFYWTDATGENASVPVPAAEVVQLLKTPAATYVIANTRLFKISDDGTQTIPWPGPDTIRQAALSAENTLLVASESGLKELRDGEWAAVPVRDAFGRDWGAQSILGVAIDKSNSLWVATKAGAARRKDTHWTFFEGKDGLPWNDFTCVATAPDGSVWFGTRLGALRYDGNDWHYRQGPRWLPHDHVRQIAADPNGTVWIATAGGIVALESASTTLSKKADHYENEIEKFIKRTPFGFVSEAALKRPADRASAAPQDSDNDGMWTAMYGAGEAFAYAATRDAQAKTRAQKAFEALRFLQKVTQGGTMAPPKGYVARTIVPTTGSDPNEGRLAHDREAQKSDKLWKAYEPRWPKSADGKWYWKSDTSSDELDGHYFFYPLYFEFCAEDDTEKERVREVVRDLTDHLIAHDFTLVDHDGKPTRWGVYGPQELNKDHNWWQERGLKSLSILSYLAVAEYVTGDHKYGEVSRKLIDQHGYAQNAMHPKVQHGPGSGNQSDDEMAFMCFYTLLRYSKDAALKDAMRVSLYRYWVNEHPEMNPLFNFVHAASCSGSEGTTPFGKFPLSPWAGWLDDSLTTLRGFPMDRLNWPSKNSHRLDIVPLAKVQAVDITDPNDQGRGVRVQGKVLPVENRHFNHWNTDPWRLDYGGSADELAAGTVFLLPYYMGLYHGFIQKP